MSPDETSPRRHLAAVWFADIVGFTTLAARDELAALKHIDRLQELAREAAAELQPVVDQARSALQRIAPAGR